MPGDPVFRRTQFAGTLLVILAFVAGWVYATGRLTGAPAWMIDMILLFMLLTGILFSSMTIQVSHEYLEWWFTFGFLHRKVRLADVLGSEEIRTPVLSGYGVRGWGDNTLWRVSGRKALRLTLKDGRALALGNDDPPALAKALDRAKNQPAAAFRETHTNP